MTLHYERRCQPHWLYRMYDADGVLLYVGQTCQPEARMTGWASAVRQSPRKRWFLSVRSITWQRFPDWWTVTEAEKAAVKGEGPLHNIYLQPKGLVAANAACADPTPSAGRAAVIELCQRFGVTAADLRVAS